MRYTVTARVVFTMQVEAEGDTDAQVIKDAQAKARTVIDEVTKGDTPVDQVFAIQDISISNMNRVD
jgi:hypothetical protein